MRCPFARLEEPEEQEENNTVGQFLRGMREWKEVRGNLYTTWYKEGVISTEVKQLWTRSEELEHTLTPLLSSTLLQSLLREGYREFLSNRWLDDSLLRVVGKMEKNDALQEVASAMKKVLSKGLFQIGTANE